MDWIGLDLCVLQSSCTYSFVSSRAVWQVTERVRVETRELIGNSNSPRFLQVWSLDTEAYGQAEVTGPSALNIFTAFCNSLSSQGWQFLLWLFTAFICLQSQLLKWSSCSFLKLSSSWPPCDYYSMACWLLRGSCCAHTSLLISCVFCFFLYVSSSAYSVEIRQKYHLGEKIIKNITLLILWELIVCMYSRSPIPPKSSLRKICTQLWVLLLFFPFGSNLCCTALGCWPSPGLRLTYLGSRP